MAIMTVINWTTLPHERKVVHEAVKRRLVSINIQPTVVVGHICSNSVTSITLIPALKLLRTSCDFSV